MRRRLFGDDHADTAASCNNVTFRLEQQGRHADAEPLHRRSLDLRRQAYGEQHQATAVGYANLAQHLAGQGRHPEAQTLYRTTLDITRAALGEEHPDTTTADGNLAVNLLWQGYAVEAEGLFRKALAIDRTARSRAPDFTLLTDAAWQHLPENPSGQPALRAEAFAALQDAVATSAGSAVAQSSARFAGGNPRRCGRRRRSARRT